jgi:hypothetical protein
LNRCLGIIFLMSSSLQNVSAIERDILEFSCKKWYEYEYAATSSCSLETVWRHPAWNPF